MQANYVDVHLNDGSSIGVGELEVHHSDSILTFRNDLWVSDGAHRIGETLFTRYTRDNQTMYVKTQEVCKILQQTTGQTKQRGE